MCFGRHDGVLGTPVDLNSLDFRLDNQGNSPKREETSVETEKQSKASNQATSKGLETILTQMETEFELPCGLLRSIAKVESNFSPNAVNTRGRGHYFNTATEAAEFVNGCLDKGIKNISVGCLQLLYSAHKKAFGNSALNMLNPEKNARYAAQYLKNLSKRYGTWEMAIKRYHSPNPRSGAIYLAKILKLGYIKDSL